MAQKKASESARRKLKEAWAEVTTEAQAGAKRLKEAFGEEHEHKNGYLEIPTKCPVSGGELYVSELTCEETGVTIRGKFRIPRNAALDEDKQEFLQVFLRARGVISTVEKELGISYPTVRARLDSLLEEMDLAPIKEDAVMMNRKKKLAERREAILKQLEDGEISAEKAKSMMRRLK